MDHGIRLSTVNINAPDPSALGAFYARLLVISSRAHVLATTQLLASIRRECLA